MNKVILVGRLARDPELRYAQSGTAVCRYGLAVRRARARDGEQDVDFINIVAFGTAAEFAGKYFRKGMMVSVCGELRTSTYEQNGVKRYSTDVIVQDQEFAESKASFESRQNNGGNNFGGGSYGGHGNRQSQQNAGFAQADFPQNYDPQSDIAPNASGPDGFTPVDTTLEGDEDLPF